MSTKIKIGADELILWLRKNNKATQLPNDGINGLGLKIRKLIVKELGGIKISESQPSYWASLMQDKNIDQFNLPKNSSQYAIETQKMGQLYDNLFNW